MKILLNRSDAIGDLILSLPLIRAIKKQRPQTQIGLIVSPRNHKIVAENPEIDRVWTLPLGKSKSEQIKFLKDLFREFRPSHFLHLGGSLLPCQVAFTSGVPFRGGLRNKWMTFLFLNKGRRQRRSQVNFHEKEYNLQFLNDLGLNYHLPDESIAPKIFLSAEEKESAYNKFDQHLKINPRTDDFLFLHPGMTGHTLSLLPKRYAELIKLLLTDKDFATPIVVSYTQADSTLIDEVKTELSSNELDHSQLHFFDGAAVGLRGFTALIEKACLMICGSTGPLHLADAMKTPILTFFSPLRVQSSKRWGPYHSESSTTVVLSPAVSCPEAKQCAKEKCPYYDCMDQWEVNVLANHAKDLAQKGRKHDTSERGTLQPNS